MNYTAKTQSKILVHFGDIICTYVCARYNEHINLCLSKVFFVSRNVWNNPH
jgi:hypothetical protein